MKQNFYVITGGPGVGKTGVIDALKSQGFLTVPEDARPIIREQLATGGDGLPWRNKERYARLMLKASLKSYDEMCKTDTSNPVFFDRGILDTICYMTMEQIPISKPVIDHVNSRPYHKHVFILPPWKEIYGTDRERKQSWEDAELTFEAMRETYLRFGYQVIEVPRGGIADRVQFITNHLADPI
ncbi:AAA family ATPase [Olivibacter sp. XZL3]|uniref:AAA family ATPase n=1 Tax=Olivibacter sp. XZL3 TaxID=1735116 RepID=UPI0010671916|nr:AAA family ATPase [Olivibacter sp. XZL3]